MARSKRTKPSFTERSLGMQGGVTAQAADWFSNVLARTGIGTSSLENGTTYDLVRWSLAYQQVYSFFESSWIARRIVDAPAQDMIKCWPTVLGETPPEDLDKVNRVIRRTGTKNKVLDGIWKGRLFGGAGALIAVKGHEDNLDEPLELDDIELNSYRGLIVFDRWSGIYPSGEVCTDIERPLDFDLPEFYECTGKYGQSFRAHCSRIIRFTGPLMPEPENSVYQGWGISVLAPIVPAIASCDNVLANALSLSYRAQLIGMTDDTLSQLLSGVGASQKAQQAFANRMSAVNQTLSNQSMLILPKDGALTTTAYSFGGLYDLIQAFQLQVAGAAKMPVSLLWGRTLNGLGQAGDGDERIYEKTIATETDTTLRPALEKLMPVIFASEVGEVPDDMELDFPSIRVLTEQEKAELAKSTVDAVTVCINSGIMSPRTAGKEIKQQSSTTQFGTNLTDDAIAKLSDDVQSEGELGEGLFGEEGGKTLSPSSSPEAALKETDKLKGGTDPEDEPPTGGAGKGPVKRPETPTGSPSDADKDPNKAKDTLARAKAVLERSKAADEDGPAVLEFTVHGLPIVIETPKGRYREGRGWRTRMPAHYGYIGGVSGADGDSMDCYLGNDLDSHWCYVVDQRALGGDKVLPKFDEHKCVIGAPSMRAALDIYNRGHHRSKEVYMDITPLHLDDFKQWLSKGDHTKPLGTAKP